MSNIEVSLLDRGGGRSERLVWQALVNLSCIGTETMADTGVDKSTQKSKLFPNSHLNVGNFSLKIFHAVS